MPDKSVYELRIWTDAERTILIRELNNGNLEITQRDHPDHTWGPPTTLHKEKT